MVAASAVGAVAVPVSAAEAGPRVIARKLADGRIEFGVRTAAGADLLPAYRFMAWADLEVATGEHDGYYETSPVLVRFAGGRSAHLVVLLRRTAAGRVEVDLLAVDPSRPDPDNPDYPAVAEDVRVWLPDRGRSFRYDTAPVGRWLRSAPAVVEWASEMAPDAAPAAAGTGAVPSAVTGCTKDGTTLYCTPPAGRPSTWTEYRTFVDAAVAMLRPHMPWIATALNDTGGWALGDCASLTDTAAGCYFHADKRIVLDQSVLARYSPFVGFGVLIHELAHAYDFASTPADRLEDQPSVRHMTAYPVALRFELFADAVKVLVLGRLARPSYYANARAAFGAVYDSWRDWGWVKEDRATFMAAVDRVPSLPTSADLAAAWKALCGGCRTSPPTVVWSAPDGGTIKPPAQPPGIVDIPEPPLIVVGEPYYGCTWAHFPERDDPIPPHCLNDPDVRESIEAKCRIDNPLFVDVDDVRWYDGRYLEALAKGRRLQAARVEECVAEAWRRIEARADIEAVPPALRSRSERLSWCHDNIPDRFSTVDLDPLDDYIEIGRRTSHRRSWIRECAAGAVP